MSKTDLPPGTAYVVYHGEMIRLLDALGECPSKLVRGPITFLESVLGSPARRTEIGGAAPEAPSSPKPAAPLDHPKASRKK